jgi:hypothetical protein
MMTPIVNIIPHIFDSERNRSYQDIDSALPFNLGSREAISKMTKIITIAINIPGKMPAISSFDIDCCVITPYKTNKVLGGINGDKLALAATHPQENESGYLYRLITGTHSLAKIADAAKAEPQAAPKNAPVTTVLTAGPPGILPSHFQLTSSISSAMPAKASKDPMRMNTATTV